MVTDFSSKYDSPCQYASNIDEVEKSVAAEVNNITQGIDGKDLAAVQAARANLNRLKKALQAQRLSATEKHDAACPFKQTMERLRALEKSVEAQADAYKAMLLGEDKQKKEQTREHLVDIWDNLDHGDISFDDAMEATDGRWLDWDDEQRIHDDMRKFVMTTYVSGVVWTHRFFGTYHDMEAMLAWESRRKVINMAMNITKEAI